MWPSWSPDGSEIAFQSSSGGAREVWIVPSSGGTPRRLTEEVADTVQPSWSPDGNSIAFGSTQSGGWNVWRVSSDGTGSKQLGDLVASRAYWSPDGKWLYGVSQTGTRNVWAVSADNGEAHPVTDLAGRYGSLQSTSLATDGTYLYLAWQESQGDIWVADLLYE